MRWMESETLASPPHAIEREPCGREEGSRVGGRKEGVWTRWYPQGGRSEVATYRWGRLHGPVTRWHPTGRVRAELHYVHGQLHGPWAIWHPTGHMAEEGEWIEGCPHRDYTRFWRNGRCRLVGTFDRGLPVDTWRIHSHQGLLMYEGGWDPALVDWLTPTVRDVVTARAYGHAGTRATPNASGRVT